MGRDATPTGLRGFSSIPQCSQTTAQHQIGPQSSEGKGRTSTKHAVKTRVKTKLSGSLAHVFLGHTFLCASWSNTGLVMPRSGTGWGGLTPWSTVASRN